MHENRNFRRNLSVYTQIDHHILTNHSDDQALDCKAMHARPGASQLQSNSKIGMGLFLGDFW